MPFISNPHLSFIDLFSGCGGNSWGMSQAGKTIAMQPLLAVDIEQIALKTYKFNHPSTQTLFRDISKLSASELLKQIGLTPGKLGCLVASPPCQSYSRNNRTASKKQDERNTLYLHTLRLIKGVEPLCVFMENVPEMKTHHNGVYHDHFVENLEKLGYVVKYWTVNSADHGIPQRRSRLIYLAFHKKLGQIPEKPAETHSESGDLLPQWIGAKDAIGDLPVREVADQRDSFDAKIYSNERSEYAQQLAPRRNHVFNHSSRSLNEIQVERLNVLEEGQAYYDLPKRLRPKKGYDSSYGRLWQDKPAQTITTWVQYPSSGRFSHYEQNRVITIREALRLQSFGDDFRVFGTMIEQSKQVGNAVPPLLAQIFKDSFAPILESWGKSQSEI